MYNQTEAQVAAEKRLGREGFKFSNWISAAPDADGGDMGDGESGTMVMVRRGSTPGSREYREIEPDGACN